MKAAAAAVALSAVLSHAAGAFTCLPVSSHRQATSPSSLHELRMVDANIVQGAGIAAAGLVAGIGLVAFTEQQGERAKERGGGLSDNMSTQLSGMLMEDVEVSSVQDVGSLASQLEAALKASGGTDEEQLELSEEEKKKLQEEADDGW